MFFTPATTSPQVVKSNHSFSFLIVFVLFSFSLFTFSFFFLLTAIYLIFSHFWFFFFSLYFFRFILHIFFFFFFIFFSFSGLLISSFSFSLLSLYRILFVSYIFLNNYSNAFCLSAIVRIIKLSFPNFLSVTIRKALFLRENISHSLYLYRRFFQTSIRVSFALSIICSFLFFYFTVAKEETWIFPHGRTVKAKWLKAETYILW